MNQKDQQQIEKLISRDKKAAREFYLTYYPRIYNFIHKKIALSQDTEELVQDTLLAFLENCRDFSGNCSINTYLCSIAKNKIVDYYRKQKLKKIVFSQLPGHLAHLIDELADPQKILDEKLLQQTIAQIFTKITPRYAKVLRLKYIENRSIAEIAQITSSSFKAVESVLFRARRMFAKIYATK